MSSLSDDELVCRGRAGSEAALTELYLRYRPRVMRFVVRMTGDPDLAEEVFCSTFAAFFGSLDRYRPSGKLAPYLFRIARSKLARECGHRRRLGSELPPDGVPAPDAAAADGDDAARVRRSLAALPPPQREVVVMRLYDGLDYAAIGEVVGANPATVRSRMRYALRALRAALWNGTGN